MIIPGDTRRKETQETGFRYQKRTVPPVYSYGVFLLCLLFCYVPAASAKTIRISILQLSSIRQSPIKGLKDELATHGLEAGYTFDYQLFDAAGNRSRLAELAAELIAGKPDVAIAAGGVEADTLAVTSQGTDVPVVFLLAASSVQRGIVASLLSSGNNLTGIDTNDTQLMAKRLWFIRKMLPEARKLFCFHVPSIVPSVEGLAVARKSAAQLGFELQVVEVETHDDIRDATKNLSSATIDVIFELPVAPIRSALKSIIFPKAMAENIPVFGHDMTSIKSGAFACYEGSQYGDGKQAARLVHKILSGIAPRDIPIETPEKIELIINRNMVERLGLKIPGRVWRMADQVFDLQI